MAGDVMEVRLRRANGTPALFVLCVGQGRTNVNMTSSAIYCAILRLHFPCLSLIGLLCLSIGGAKANQAQAAQWKTWSQTFASVLILLMGCRPIKNLDLGQLFSVQMTIMPAKKHGNCWWWKL